jgi:predicted transcriptional regulator
MPDREHIKAQFEICKTLFYKDVKRLEERFIFMDKALELHDKVMEHRLKSLNELREEVTRDRNKFVTKEVFDLVDKRLASVETRSTVWVGVIIVAFAVLEVILRYIK